MLSACAERPLVFISYSSKQFDLVNKIKEAIDGHFGGRIETWMAAFDMYGAPLTAMGANLKRAAMVMMCVSSSYEASKYCLSEASMGFNANKEMLVLIMEEHYDPTNNETLNPIVTLPMRKECFSAKKIEAALPSIFKEIERGIENRFHFNYFQAIIVLLIISFGKFLLN